MENEKQNIVEGVKVIVTELQRTFGDRVKNAVLYGTAISDDFSSTSDFDVLLSFDQVNSSVILGLRQIIKACADKGVLVDFNLHSTEEMPEKSQDEFWHNNRGLIFQKEISLFGVPILGENPYKKHPPSTELIKADIRRHVSGLVYRGRKALINTQLGYRDKLNLVKFVLYAISNLLAYNGNYYQNKQEIVDEFHIHFPEFGSVQKYLDLKKDPSRDISEEDAFSALLLLEQISSLLYQLGMNSQEQS